MVCRSILVAVLLAAAMPAFAHDPGTGAPNWITQGHYVSPQTGVHCCGPNDCERIASADVQPRPDGLWLKTFGELVPYSQATPSEDGQYWRCHTEIINRLDGSKSGGDRRCFFAPVGTQ